jgi:hypothetical protein
MAKSKRAVKTPKKIFGEDPRRPGRGRPRKVDPSDVSGWARSYRALFDQYWNELGVPLLEAQTDAEVVNALQGCNLDNHFSMELAPVILTILKSPNFPKRRASQIKFLANSIAGGKIITPRRSRDICAEQEKAVTKEHRIVRYEYWIECSCGYEGPSLHLCCRDCGALLDAPGANPEIM